MSVFVFICAVYFILSCEKDVFIPDLLKIIQFLFLGFGFSTMFWRFNSKIHFIFFSLLFISIFTRIFYLPEKNPFYFFYIPSNQFLFSSFLSFLLFLVNNCYLSNKLIEKLTFWSPIVFMTIVNTYFNIFNFNKVDPHDAARHISSALSIYEHFVSEQGQKFVEGFGFYDFYFPLSYLSSFPFFLLFGKSHTSGTLTLSLFWLPLAYYYLWKIQFNYIGFSKWVCSLVSFIFLSTSISSSIMKMYMQDLPTLVLCVAFYYYFFKSKFLSLFKESVLCSVVFGFCLLTKTNLLFICFIPLFFSLFFGFKNNTLSKSFVYVLNFVFISSAIASLWFSINIFHFSFALNEAQETFGKTFPEPFSVDSLPFYPKAFFKFNGYFYSYFILIFSFQEKI